MPISGLDLRSERRAADITVVALSAHMGISRQAVHALERSALVKVERVAQYRKALADAITASQEKVA